MILSDLPTPAEASNETRSILHGFAQAGNRFPLFGIMTFCWRMILSDLPTPAEASNETRSILHGFAQAGNQFPLFGIMR
jgi:hypothetical protein